MHSFKTKQNAHLCESKFNIMMLKIDPIVIVHVNHRLIAKARCVKFCIEHFNLNKHVNISFLNHKKLT